jgi:hypothetical protein
MEMRICPKWNTCMRARRGECNEAKPHQCSGSSFYCGHYSRSLSCILVPKEYKKSKIKEPVFGQEEYLARMGIRKGLEERILEDDELDDDLTDLFEDDEDERE